MIIGGSLVPALFLRCRFVGPDILFIDVLLHCSSQGNGQCLYAAADAEDRNLTVECQSGQHQFGQVALGIDVVQVRRRLFAGPERIDVAASCKEKSVKMGKRVHENILVGYRRYEDRDAARSGNLLIVDIPQRSITVREVRRYADYGLLLCFGEGRIHLVEMRL